MFPLSQPQPIDYLVIGHITKDLTPEGLNMGGTASYAALTAKNLGLRVGVVTSWGEELPLEEMADITIVNHHSKESTTFENIYTPEGRQQVIHHIAHPLGTTAVPDAWENTPIVHLGPVAQEVSHHLIKHFPRSLVGVSPQGWLRDWDRDGIVHPTPLAGGYQILRDASVTIISLEDIGEDENIIEEMANNCPVLVVTESYLGARVYWLGDVRRLNAPKVGEINATGAGDIFAAAFLTQYHKTRDPWESARFANQLAAQSVTRSGLRSVPNPSEVKKAQIEVLL